jgi:hypothetical protein
LLASRSLPPTARLARQVLTTCGWRCQRRQVVAATSAGTCGDQDFGRPAPCIPLSRQPVRCPSPPAAWRAPRVIRLCAPLWAPVQGPRIRPDPSGKDHRGGKVKKVMLASRPLWMRYYTDLQLNARSKKSGADSNSDSNRGRRASTRPWFARASGVGSLQDDHARGL